MKAFSTISILILLLQIIFASISKGQPQRPQFEHLSPEEGIAHNMVYCIHQDRNGFMWFGTMYGLIRYDGHDYKVYRNDPADSSSISYDDVTAIYEDSAGHLWIGTWGGGLNKFDPQTERFERLVHQPGNEKSLSHNIVWAIYEDRRKNIWVGTDNGLNRLTPVLSEETDQEIQNNYHIKRFFLNLDNTNSLSNNRVLAICEDARGDLWIGTQNGLNRYNYEKQSFTMFFHMDHDYTGAYNSAMYRLVDTLQAQGRQIAAIDRPGNFAGHSKTFTLKKRRTILAVTMGEGRSELFGEKIDEMFDYGWIESPDGEIIWKMKLKNSRYAGGALKNRIEMHLLNLEAGRYHLRYKSDDSHSSPMWNNYPPRHPELWGFRVFTLNAEQQKKAMLNIDRQQNRYPNSISGNAITALFPDRKEDALWIGTRYNGLNKLDLDSMTFSHYKQNDENSSDVGSNTIQSIYQDSSGILWIGTNEGLTHFDVERNRFVHYRHDPPDPASISGNNIVALCEDRSGILWIASYHGGVDKLDKRKNTFRHLRQRSADMPGLCNDNVFTVEQDHEGQLWIGTWGGGIDIYSPDEERFQCLHHKYGTFDGKQIHDIEVTNDHDIWIAAAGKGLLRYSPDSGEFDQFLYDNRDSTSISSNTVTVLLEDRNGYIWAGTYGNGLNRFDQQSSRFRRYYHNPERKNSLSHNSILSLYEDREGNLWVGTYKGLNKLDSTRTQIQRYQQNLSDPNSLSHNYVYDIYQDSKGTLWIGTAGGLDRLNVEQGSFHRFTNSGTFANRVIYKILEDRRGHLWVSTNKGLFKIFHDRHTVESYDVSDGLQSNIFNAGAGVKLSDGRMVFGGINGLNIFHPERVARDTFIPPIHITEVTAFDQPLEIQRHSKTGNRIELDYSDNFLTLKFAALDFSSPRKNRYSYFMEGVDRSWIDAGNRNTAHYTNLRPGRYTFRVKGSNSDGVWNPDEAQLTIIIHPPFWQTWWFYSLMTAIGLAIFVAAYKFRIRRKIRRLMEIQEIKEREAERVRKKAAQDFHDELGHKLTKISLFTAIIKRNPCDDTLHHYIERIDQTAKSVSGNLRDFIWNLDPNKDSLYDTMIRLKDFGDDLFDKTGIAFRTAGIEERLKPIKLTLDWRQQLTRIIKEAMHNILKHSDCHNVLLEVSSANGELVIVLHDDGRGMNDDGEGNGFGLDNMKERARKLGGHLEIESGNGSGTRISFVAPSITGA